jgi:hypothetical protein
MFCHDPLTWLKVFAVPQKIVFFNSLTLSEAFGFVPLELLLLTTVQWLTLFGEPEKFVFRAKVPPFEALP